MSLVEDLVMLAMVIAVAAAVLVGLMVLLYAWVLRRRQEMDEREPDLEENRYPPDGRFEL